MCDSTAARAYYVVTRCIVRSCASPLKPLPRRALNALLPTSRPSGGSSVSRSCRSSSGRCSAAVALGLLDLIGLFTHLLYYGNVGVSLVPPTLSHLHAWTALIPVGGGAVIGAMAYFGSERIRGHGIPEAMETILVGGSKVEPRLAILKPISSAI